MEKKSIVERVTGKKSRGKHVLGEGIEIVRIGNRLGAKKLGKKEKIEGNKERLINPARGKEESNLWGSFEKKEKRSLQGASLRHPPT